jgi:hypothetical protein
MYNACYKCNSIFTDDIDFREEHICPICSKYLKSISEDELNYLLSEHTYNVCPNCDTYIHKKNGFISNINCPIDNKLMVGIK